MSDLTPITRDEHLLNGDDLEPMNRKEMFLKRIYDKTQSVPEPETREEYFLKKAGDASGELTIEQLNVTENGTYSASGKAYSPVIVEVPVPQSYLVKDVPNLPQSIATIDDAIVAPIIKLKANIEAVQSGSGDPSPSNIRPISGWDGANVLVQAVVDPTAEADYSISWQTQCGTVYGGNFKLFKDGGKCYCTVAPTKIYVKGGWEQYNSNNGYKAYRKTIAKRKTDTSPYTDVMSNMISTFGSFNSSSMNRNIIQPPTTSQAMAYMALDENVDSNDVELVFDLLEPPTPTTFEISTEIATLLGDNNIFADCGDIEECRYVTGVL